MNTKSETSCPGCERHVYMTHPNCKEHVEARDRIALHKDDETLIADMNIIIERYNGFATDAINSHKLALLLKEKWVILAKDMASGPVNSTLIEIFARYTGYYKAVNEACGRMEELARHWDGLAISMINDRNRISDIEREMVVKRCKKCNRPKQKRSSSRHGRAKKISKKTSSKKSKRT